MEKKLNNIPFFTILGIKINELTIQKTIDVIDLWIKKRERKYIILTGAHGIVEMQKDKRLRGINNNADLVTPDGMPVVWLGKLKGFKNIEKVYAPDIMIAVFEFGIIKGYRHFFLGGKEGIADLLSKKMIKRFHDFKVVGTYCPPFRKLTNEEEQKIAHIINEANPDIVWVGLGCPKQEYWISRFRPFLNSPVLIGVGAGFDFHSGEKPLAPRWIKNSGFEWLFRMLSDPKRLWPRYSRVVPKFTYLNMLHFLGLKKY